MKNKVFVGGLNWNTSEGGLESVMNQAGEVIEVKIILDRITGRSRGFGFVTFSDESGANQAIEMFDGQEIEGRNVKVNLAEDKPRGGGGVGRDPMKGRY